MQNQYGYIYESSQYEQFERSILSGHLTENALLEMASTGKLDERQMVIAEGFFGKLRDRAAGWSQGAKAIGNNVGAAYNAASNAIMGNDTPSPGRTNVKSAIAHGRQSSAIQAYTKKLLGTLQEYLTHLRELKVLPPNVEQIINNVSEQLQLAAMGPHQAPGSGQQQAPTPQGQAVPNNNQPQFSQAAAPQQPTSVRGLDANSALPRPARTRTRRPAQV